MTASRHETYVLAGRRTKMHKDAQSMFTYADETRGLETLQIHMFMALAT